MTAGPRSRPTRPSSRPSSPRSTAPPRASPPSRPTSPPATSPRSPALRKAALAALIRLETCKVSDMIGLADNRILVYAQEKKLPDLSPANPRYAEIQGQLMTFIASNNENSVLGDLVEQELKKTSKT